MQQNSLDRKSIDREADRDLRNSSEACRINVDKAGTGKAKPGGTTGLAGGVVRGGPMVLVTDELRSKISVGGGAATERKELID